MLGVSASRSGSHSEPKKRKEERKKERAQDVRIKEKKNTRGMADAKSQLNLGSVSKFYAKKNTTDVLHEKSRSRKP